MDQRDEQEAQGRQCLRKGNAGHVCEGPVTGRESYAGTGTTIYECGKAQAESYAWHQEHRERYPDTPTPPAWFDPGYAGEQWNED